MREWLKFFVLLHRKFFEQRAHSYLESKGLSLDNWSESITDGQKGDVLVLYCLNMLTESHTVLHLKNGLIWTILQDFPPEHNYQLGCADNHLAYLGWGLFVQLVPQDTPLWVIRSTSDTKQIVIGELSASESKTLDSI